MSSHKASYCQQKITYCYAVINLFFGISVGQLVGDTDELIFFCQLIYSMGKEINVLEAALKAIHADEH